MLAVQPILLIVGVVGVGILHTMVPDHWAPIALLARQRGWSRAETARAALAAGSGHVVTTLLFGVAVWMVGAVAAQSLGRIVDVVASLALVAFGLWIAVGAWREVRSGGGDHHHGEGHHHHHRHDRQDDHAAGSSAARSHEHTAAWSSDPLYAPARGMAIAERHIHMHRHGMGRVHAHWHDHGPGTSHAVGADIALSPPPHMHRHRTSGRMSLLLLLGSSPMVESIPAFFAASRFGVGLVVVLGLAFAVSTIATYVVLSVSAASGLQRLDLGPIERYGEVISGAFIAVLGAAFGVWSLV